jgi:hypothetical protein
MTPSHGWLMGWLMALGLPVYHINLMRNGNHHEMGIICILPLVFKGRFFCPINGGHLLEFTRIYGKIMSWSNDV